MKKKIICSAVILVICVGLFTVCMLKKPSQKEEQIILENQYSREAYLNIRGWDIEEISHEIIKIPENFNGVYKEYASVQKSQNLSLEKYKGKEAERFLYSVKNRGENNVFVELLIRENRLIAAALIESGDEGNTIKPISNS